MDLQKLLEEARKREIETQTVYDNITAVKGREYAIVIHMTIQAFLVSALIQKTQRDELLSDLIADMLSEPIQELIKLHGFKTVDIQLDSKAVYLSMQVRKGVA